MNESRFRSIYNGLTTVCQKVYTAVPIAESWTPREICGELARIGAGVHRDARIVGGCINSLIGSGLVTESPRGKFKRVKISNDQPASTEIKEIKVPTIDNTKPKQINVQISAIDRLSVLASQLKSLAKEIEEAAIEIEERGSADAEARKRLEQLQTLLKGA